MKTYFKFVFDAEQSIKATILTEGLDAEKCLPAEFSGYASAVAASVAADSAAAAAAV